MTGSEPLSLEEEHKMQESWRDADDKCTFIVLSREAFQDGNEENAMIGDTNLFIQNTDSTGTYTIRIVPAFLSTFLEDPVGPTLSQFFQTLKVIGIRSFLNVNDPVFAKITTFWGCFFTHLLSMEKNSPIKKITF